VKLFGVYMVLVVLAVAGLTIYMLPRDDTIDDTDAVVVLGGPGIERAELGIELAERYDAELVLSSNARRFGDQLGRTCGVDAVCFDPVPENTAGEAENVTRMAEDRGWEHITVTTSSFHTTRSRFLFQQCLGRDRIAVLGADGDGGGSMTPLSFLRETAGLIAGATIRRAC
jgi:uncharacterized SAM-binding protein YcdF (DUF218 family)